MSQAIPCLIIAYRRLEGVQRLMGSLHEYSVSKIYLSIDGPRNSQDLQIQKEIEEWTIQFADMSGIELHVLRHKKNLGVAVSIICALDWFYSHVPFGVVLEDDLEISQEFLKFVLFCKERFAGLENLWMISGNQFFPESMVLNEISVSNYPLVWGWATWSGRWSQMRASILRQKKFSPFFLFSPVKAFWWAGSKRVLSGVVDTWDIPLAFEMERRKRVTFSPPVNLVKNIGYDTSASHTHMEQFPLNLDTEEGVIDYSTLGMSKNIDSSANNKLLEQYVFRVQIKHILSPFKYFLFKPRFSGSKPLMERLRET